MILLAIWAILALPGTILNAPMFITASILSRKKAKGKFLINERFINSVKVSPEALAASVVKIAGRDVLATWKILIALGITPVLYSIYAVLATLISIKANVTMLWRLATPFLVIITLPFMNYAALKFGEAGMDVLK